MRGPAAPAEPLASEPAGPSVSTLTQLAPASFDRSIWDTSSNGTVRLQEHQR